MARDKLITIRIEGEKRDAFNQLAKSQNTDTASLLYDFISGCLDSRIDILLVTGKGQRIDNQLDDDRLNKIDNRIDGIETTTQRLAKRLDDWIEAFSDRLSDCDQVLSEKIISLEHRLNALSSQLDSQQDSQLDRQQENPPPSPPAIKTEIVSLSPSATKEKGLTDSELARHLGIDKSNITRWKQKGEPTQKYRETWELRGRFWYEKD
jgi:chromosome segregation ATPase